MKHEKRERRARKKDKLIVAGTISVSTNGYGFVAVDGSETELSGDVFIPAQYINGAINGDKVKVEVLPPDDRFPNRDKGPAGRVIAVTERLKDEFIGELLAGGKVRPLNRQMPELIEINGSLKKAKRGDWVRVKLDPEQHRGEFQGEIQKVIGKVGVIAADLDAICDEFGIPPRYTAEDDQAALAIEPREIERLDCSRQLTVTIDPFDAKDFDDAMSISANDEKFIELGVHISDVASYIASKSKFDKSAAMRGFTCYLPGRTMPMLPKGLTAKISLQAKVDSFAHTVFVTVDKATGEVVKTRRAHTIIKVDHRLNYEEVQAYVEHGTAPADWSEPLKNDLKEMYLVTQKMREFRKKTEQFIDLELPEIRVICDENKNQIIDIVKKTSRESEVMVEECMLAANSAVGVELGVKSVAGLYRVHPIPDAEKIAEFSAMIYDSFGLVTGDLTSRKVCNDFINRLPDDEKKPVILSLLLRSLPRASYSEKAELHFGLGKTRYCHFTSPIRRYADLTVHQQLWNLDTNARLRATNTMTKLAADLSEKEENCDSAYYSANDMLKLRYLQGLLDAGGDNFYEGVVVKINTAGLQVDIRELGLYGLVPRETLPGAFRVARHKMHQQNADREYKIGNIIYLTLKEIDWPRRVGIFKIKL